MTKYLSHFPKPLLDDLVSGRWLPVVGAGMSLNANVPPGKKMPLWVNMSKELVGDLTDFSASSVLDGISAYEHEFGRAKLIERLSEILFIREAQPGIAHKEFCALPFDIVCTTNFDFLLERQYDLTPRYVYPVVDEEQLSINVGSAGTLLLKLHGDIRHPARLVVTESDYDGFLTRYPLLATYLSNQLITKTAVFVGYSLDDPDFRQIWHVVSQRLGHTRRKAYTIAVNLGPSEIARFERRGVKVINLPGTVSKYGEILAATFKELGEYIRDNVVAVSKVTEERPLRELLLPRDTSTRLCFFSMPLELLPFYREAVFPVVEEAGFVPVTADDVVIPGDTVSTKLDMLVDRASVMVVEIASNWTQAEFRMALSRLKEAEADDHASKASRRRPFQLIVVVTDYDQVPSSVTGFQVLQRPSVISTYPDGFIADLAGILRDFAERAGVQRQAEPERLYQAKEYRSAVISAMTLLEGKLRDRLNKSPWLNTKRPMSLRQLVDRALEENLIQPQIRAQIDEWMRLRNEVVHSSVSVSATRSRQVLDGVNELLAEL